jgi:hypothetical protein
MDLPNHNKNSHRHIPYELAFGIEIVILIEPITTSFRTLCYIEVRNEEGHRVALDLVQERRNTRHAFERRVALKYYQLGDLVLR